MLCGSECACVYAHEKKFKDSLEAIIKRGYVKAERKQKVTVVDAIDVQGVTINADSVHVMGKITRSHKAQV